MYKNIYLYFESKIVIEKNETDNVNFILCKKLLNSASLFKNITFYQSNIWNMQTESDLIKITNIFCVKFCLRLVNETTCARLIKTINRDSMMKKKKNI